jgi:hypothetical protein
MEVIDLTAGDIDQIIQTLSATNPALEQLGPQIRSVLASGGKLFAIDSSGAATTGFSDNINVIATIGSGSVTGSAVQSQMEQQLTSIGATDITFEVLTIHGRDILTSSYSAVVNKADGTPTTFFGRQALVPAAGHTWIITYSTGAPDDGTFDTVIRSFDVTE